jgi:hypothetical protein
VAAASTLYTTAEESPSAAPTASAEFAPDPQAKRPVANKATIDKEWILFICFNFETKVKLIVGKTNLRPSLLPTFN